MNRKWLVVLVGLCVLLSVCGRGSEKTTVTITETAREYETISYQAFRERTGQEAEFYHATLFIGGIPDSSITVIFEGAYDDEAAGAVLSDDAVPIRLQGLLGDLLDGVKEKMPLSEFTNALSAAGAAKAVFERREGAGTAYYVGNDYVQIPFDSDRNGECDRLLLISMDEAAEDTVGQESDAWLEMLPVSK